MLDGTAGVLAFLGVFLVLVFGFGVGSASVFMFASRSASLGRVASDGASPLCRFARDVLRNGVPALFLPLGFGVPFLLPRLVLGLPRRRGVGSSPRSPPSSSVNPLKGTLVVVVACLLRLGLRVGDKVKRRLFTPLRRPRSSSASTVTSNRCGDRSFPTSNSKVCFLGDFPADSGLACLMLLGICSEESRWYGLRFPAVRRVIVLIELGTSSPSGSGDELKSIRLVIVALGYAIGC